MTAIGRLFGSLANALLDLGLPRIRAWLRERVGPAADLAQVSTEGAFIHLDGVRLPLGARGELVLDRATAQLTGARSGAAVLPEVRLHAFRGVLRFGGGGDQLKSHDELRADVVFTASAQTDAAAWVSGELTIANATWSLRGTREGAPALAPMGGRAKLVVTSDTWRLDDGILDSDLAHVRFSGRGLTGGADAGDPPDAGAPGGAIHAATLGLDGARVGPFVDAIQAMLGRAFDVPPGVPLDAKLSGEVAWEATSGGSCSLQVVADGLAARVEGIVGPGGRGLAAHVDAEIAPAVPMRRANVPAALLPRDEDRLAITIDATGDASRPDVRATVRCGELGFRFGRPRFHPALVARAVEVDVEASRDVVNVRGAARVGQGTLTLDGLLPTRTRAGRRITARLVELEPAWLTSVLRVIAPAVRLCIEGDAPPAEGPRGGAVFSLPRDARIACDLAIALEARAAISGELAVVTPRSHVALRPFIVTASSAAEGADTTLTTDGTRVVGSLAAADALTLGLFPFDVRPEASGGATLDLGLSGSFDALVLSGLVAAPSLRIAIASRPEVPPFVLDDVTTTLTIDSASLSYAGGRFRAHGGAFVAEGTIPFSSTPVADPAPPLLLLRARDASASLLEALASLARDGAVIRVERDGARPAGELWIARSARVSGEARLEQDTSASAELAIETAHAAGNEESVLLASLALSPALRLDGSTVRGTVAVADVLTCGAFDGALRPLPEGKARIDAKLSGPIDALVISGFVTVARLALALHEAGGIAPAAPTFVATDLSTLFRVDTARVLWHRLQARAYGGSITSAGIVGYGGAFIGLKSTVLARDVSAGHFPIDPRNTPLAEIVRGRLTVDMRFERTGADGPVLAQGNARLDDGAFPLLERSRALLGRYGLLPPQQDAIGPATLAVELDAAGWSFTRARGAVPGCEANGDVRIGFDGTIDGALVVTLGDELLARSAVLVVPSLLAERLTLPVRIGGTVARPSVSADLGACLGSFVTDNRVTALFSEAASDVVSLFTGREPARPSTPAAAPAQPPASRRAPGSDDELLRELVAAGVDWDEIEERLDEHRRGGIRHRIG